MVTLVTGVANGGLIYLFKMKPNNKIQNDDDFKKVEDKVWINIIKNEPM